MLWSLIRGRGWKAAHGNASVSALAEAEFSLPQRQERLVSLGFWALRCRRSILYARYGTGLTNRKWAPLASASRLSRGIKRGKGAQQEKVPQASLQCADYAYGLGGL